MVAADYILIRIQHLFCDPNAFIYGPTQLGHIILIVPWFFVALPIAMAFANCAEWCIRELVGRPDSKGFRTGVRDLMTALKWITIVAVPLSLIALPSYYWASPETISLKRAFWSPPLTYRWTDVTGVVAECFHKGKQNRDSFQLIMMDGKKIDLADRPAQFIAAYPRIDASLRAADFSFSSSGLSQCPTDLEPLFARRPGTRV
jgi:hypothetical protein